MKSLLKWTAIAIVPFGIPTAIAVWLVRRALTKNAVTTVPATKARWVVMRGGKA